MDSTQLRKERGRRLTTARRRAGMTADELVRRLSTVTGGKMEFTTSALYSWEKSRNLLPDKVAIQLAPILGCSTQDLLGPLSVDELELIPLGGGPAIIEAEESKTRNKEVEIDITLRSRSDGSVIRRRGWRVSFDLDSAEIVVRPGDGCAAESLQVFRPADEGVVELRGRRDYRDMGTIRIPFDTSLIPSGDQLPALFLQPSLEVLPLFADELPAVEKPDSSIAKPAIRRRISKDIQLELADFLDVETVQRLTALWEESAEHLERYRERVLRHEFDPFCKRMQEALIDTCLLKDHERARRSIDSLQALEGDKPQKIADVAYLSGRNRWYLGMSEGGDRSELPAAIEDLCRAMTHTNADNDPVRIAQVFIYLSRIGIEHANFWKQVIEKTGHDPVELADMAKELAVQTHRLDLEILAERNHVIRLYNQNDYDECIRRGRLLFAIIRSDDNFYFENIEANLSIHVGLALRRRRASESDWIEAEDLYQNAISKGRNDSLSGMAMYLLGDLYADRMIESQSIATIAESDISRTIATDEAERHQSTAQDWYDQAFNDLQERGDRKALAKSLYRVIWIRFGKHGDSFPEPNTHQVVAQTHAARQHFLNQRLIGTRFNARPDTIPLELIKEFLSVHHLDTKNTTDQLPELNLNDYFDDRTALILPRNLGNILIALVLVPNSHDVTSMKIAGWFAVPGYGSEIRPLLKQIQQDSFLRNTSKSEWSSLKEQTAEFWKFLREKVKVIEPLRQLDASRVMVLAPHDHIEALLPIEQLLGVENQSSTILNSVEESVVYAGSWGSSLQSAKVVVPKTMISYFADCVPMQTSQSRGQSLADIVQSRLQASVNDLPQTGAIIEKDAVAVVAHSDSTGALQNLIDSWTFNKTKAVFLLFCGSGTFDLIQGPFSDGLAFRIRRSLPVDAVVVSNRFPVSVAEALRLLDALNEDRPSDLPVAQIVTKYIRERIRHEPNPFSCPWFTM